MKWPELLFDLFMYPLEIISLDRKRREFMRRVSGKVLEIGAGTGANFKHYDFSGIDHLHISDYKLTNRVKKPVSHEDTRVYFHEADVHSLPFADATFDGVVFSLVFCSVSDPALGLSEVFRVLKPGGALAFIEHVRPESGPFRRLVDVLNPAWRAFNGECNINRDTISAIRSAGFTIETIRNGGMGLIAAGVARRR